VRNTRHDVTLSYLNYTCRYLLFVRESGSLCGVSGTLQCVVMDLRLEVGFAAVEESKSGG
jgi:hypothetical protein